jgi:hypothetical protein
MISLYLIMSLASDEDDMRVGDMVLPDFPEHRTDWRSDWPDNMLGIIIEETPWDTFIIMTLLRAEDVNIEYLVAAV